MSEETKDNETNVVRQLHDVVKGLMSIIGESDDIKDEQGRRFTTHEGKAFAAHLDSAVKAFSDSFRKAHPDERLTLAMFMSDLNMACMEMSCMVTMSVMQRCKVAEFKEYGHTLRDFMRHMVDAQLEFIEKMRAEIGDKAPKQEEATAAS